MSAFSAGLKEGEELARMSCCSSAFLSKIITGIVIAQIIAAAQTVSHIQDDMNDDDMVYR
jgi:hypothetical protein